MHLTPQQLEDLTDRPRASDQITWLRDRGWRFEVSAAGRPKVAVEEWRKRMVSDAMQTTAAQVAPNLEWFKHGQEA